jgi:hypothetical protein
MPTILREVEEHVFGYSTLYSNPRFFGYMNGSGNQAAVLGELLAAAVNQIARSGSFLRRRQRLNVGSSSGWHSSSDMDPMPEGVC